MYRCERDQPASDIKLPGRQREGVDRAGIQDRHLVGEIGPLGGRDEAIDGFGDQGFEPRIVIGSAIGREYAAMLAFGGRSLGCGLVRLDRCEACV